MHINVEPVRLRNKIKNIMRFNKKREDVEQFFSVAVQEDKEKHVE